VVERGFEGYVTKDQASVYEGGATKRSLTVKVPGWTRQRQQLAAWNPIGLLTPKPGSSPGLTVNGRLGSVGRS
jgi:hypothetical protein